MTEGSVQDKFVVCVDSDGCAMDTMDIKHQLFFGPLAADIFGVQGREDFLKEWDRINLYSTTRGINRFKGLVLGLEYAQEQDEDMGNIAPLKKWTEETPFLSNQSLEEELAKNPHPSLEKTLEWSYLVNKGIKEELTGKDHPFEGVREALADLSQQADVAVVSSANREAIDSEWKRHGLMDSVTYVYGQDAGSKTAALKDIIAKGYDPTHILMVGDAPGDVEAAKNAGVSFFPILFGKEKEQWERLVTEVFPKLFAADFTADYQEQLIQEYENHLSQHQKG